MREEIWIKIDKRREGGEFYQQIEDIMIEFDIPLIKEQDLENVYTASYDGDYVDMGELEDAFAEELPFYDALWSPVDDEDEDEVGDVTTFSITN